MRVLHVTNTMSPEAGGPPIAVRGLATVLTSIGIRCEILTTTGGRFRLPSLAVSGLPVHTFAGTWLSGVWNAHSRALARFVDRHLAEFDLVHVHELWHYPGFAACRRARSCGVPYVVSLRGGLAPVALGQKPVRKRVYMELVQRPMLESASALHALTSVEADHVEALGLPTRVAVIPNGVAADIGPGVDGADPSSFLRRFPMLADRRVVLYLGRLSANKGLSLLAGSFVHVARRFEDAVLLVVGPNEGDTQAQASAVLASAGLAERATFTGALHGQDKISALACADVFVLPSSAEGFSNAVLEALAAGVPVVVSEHCNFPEVAEWDAGAVVPNDVAAVAGAICDLLADDARRDAAGRSGRRMVEERYGWSRIAGRFADLYESIVFHG